MAFIEFLDLFALYRVCWIGGRLGFGKTALAVFTARELLERGLVDGVITNFPTVFPFHLQNDDLTLHNRCIIFDEAWMYLDSRTALSNQRSYGAFARKMGAYWLFPSVHPVDRRLRPIEVRPDYKMGGLTFWKARVFTGADLVEEVKFSFDPKEVYGMYATAYIPVDDCGIHERFKNSYRLETGWEYGEEEEEEESASGENSDDLE